MPACHLYTSYIGERARDRTEFLLHWLRSWDVDIRAVRLADVTLDAADLEAARGLPELPVLVCGDFVLGHDRLADEIEAGRAEALAADLRARLAE